MPPKAEPCAPARAIGARRPRHAAAAAAAAAPPAAAAAAEVIAISSSSEEMEAPPRPVEAPRRARGRQPFWRVASRRRDPAGPGASRTGRGSSGLAASSPIGARIEPVLAPAGPGEAAAARGRRRRRPASRPASPPAVADGRQWHFCFALETPISDDEASFHPAFDLHGAVFFIDDVEGPDRPPIPAGFRIRCPSTSLVLWGSDTLVEEIGSTRGLLAQFEADGAPQQTLTLECGAWTTRIHDHSRYEVLGTELRQAAIVLKSDAPVRMLASAPAWRDVGAALEAFFCRELRPKPRVVFLAACCLYDDIVVALSGILGEHVCTAGRIPTFSSERPGFFFGVVLVGPHAALQGRDRVDEHACEDTTSILASLPGPLGVHRLHGTRMLSLYIGRDRERRARLRARHAPSRRASAATGSGEPRADPRSGGASSSRGPDHAARGGDPAARGRGRRRRRRSR